MSSPESLIEDVSYLLKKITFLDGQDLKMICRELDLPVMNMGSGEMFEKLTDKVTLALNSYRKMPSRENERTLTVFRHSMLCKSQFLKRYLQKIESLYASQKFHGGDVVM